MGVVQEGWDVSCVHVPLTEGLRGDLGLRGAYNWYSRVRLCGLATLYTICTYRVRIVLDLVSKMAGLVL